MKTNRSTFSLLRTKTPTLAIAALALVAFVGCKEKEEEDRGVTRMSGLSTSAENASASATPPPVSGAHQAPPLSELANRSPHGAMAPTTTGTADANDPNMMIVPGQTQVMQGGNILQAAGLAFTVSEDWKNVKPSTSMRVAQYELPGEAGPAEMAIFYFGRNQGGGLEDNIRRWAGQFTPDENTTQTGAQVARIEKENLRLAMVKTEGTYDPGSMGPMGPPSSGPKPNYALFGLVVEGGPEGSLFIKVTGPKETLAQHNEALEAFAQSVRVSNFQ